MWRTSEGVSEGADKVTDDTAVSWNREEEEEEQSDEGNSVQPSHSRLFSPISSSPFCLFRLPSLFIYSSCFAFRRANDTIYFQVLAREKALRDEWLVVKPSSSWLY